MTSVKTIKLAKSVALFSFVVGSVLFAAFYFTLSMTLFFLGVLFVVIFSNVNLLFFLLLLVELIRKSEDNAGLIKALLLILLNIPIAFIYGWIVVILLNTVRVTLINETKNTLTDVKLTGCEDEIIGSLKPGQNLTKWIGITGDCSINLTYNEDSKIKEEVVLGYVTSSNGQILEHVIKDTTK